MTNTLTYEVSLLQDWHKLDETFQETPDDEQQLPRDFTAAHLFIDDCADLVFCCFPPDRWPYGYPAGSIKVGGCWEWSRLRCDLCNPNADVDALCNAAVPACKGQCKANFASTGICVVKK